MCMMVISADELLAMVTYTCMTLACQRMFTQHQYSWYNGKVSHVVVSPTFAGIMDYSEET